MRTRGSIARDRSRTDAFLVTLSVLTTRCRHKQSTMSNNADASVLHYGANERRAVMLEKLGGQRALRRAIDIFYAKQIADDRLMYFFRGVNVEIIKWHQFNLMSIAFTAVPENFDLPDLLLNRHGRLFDMGLDETYFDIVAQHFKDTLVEMDVDPDLIKESLDVVMPLREVFAQGAREAQERTKRAAGKRQAVLAIVAAALAIGVVKLVKSKKK